MNQLISTPRKTCGISVDYTNEFTKALDTLLPHKSSNPRLCNYMNSKPTNWRDGGYCWAFRFPGATRGCLHLDDNMVITGWDIYKDITVIYDMTKVEILNQFIGYKVVLED